MSIYAKHAAKLRSEYPIIVVKKEVLFAIMAQNHHK